MPSKQQDRYLTGRYKSIYQVPGAEVKTIQRLLICWVLWAQGQCSAGCSVIHLRLLAQVQGEAQDGEAADCPSLLVSPVLGLALVQGKGMYLSITSLGYSSKVEQNTGSLPKFSVVRTLMKN